MGTSEGDRPLAGLVSEEAERLYARLVEANGLIIGPGDGQIDLDSPAARELLDVRIAWRSSIETNRLIAAGEARAMQVLLAHHHAELLRRQQVVMRGWERLDSFLSSPLSRSDGTPSDAEFAPEIITSRDTISRLSAELYQSARQELLGISVGTMSAPMHDHQLLTPPEQALGRGARFRMLYDNVFAADAVGSRIIEASLASGEDARIRSDLPLKMLHVDDRIALVALTPTGVDGAMLIRSPSLLAALRQWFELLWADPATTTVDGTALTALNPTQLAVLRLLSSGRSDEAIARTLNASVRTVRRHIAAILDVLGAPSRFVAGAAAAKRGWI